MQYPTEPPLNGQLKSSGLDILKTTGQSMPRVMPHESGFIVTIERLSTKMMSQRRGYHPKNAMAPSRTSSSENSLQTPGPSFALQVWR